LAGARHPDPGRTAHLDRAALNRLLIPRVPPLVRASEIEGEASPAPRGAMAMLPFVFAATWFVTGLWPRTCRASSKSLAPAQWLRSPPPLRSPSAQVAARLVGFGEMRMVHPLSARLAALLHPVGAVILGLVGPGAITACAVLLGGCNGLLTIAQGNRAVGNLRASWLRTA